MNSEKAIQDFIKEGYKTYLPNISIDCTIFGYHERTLKILLLKWKSPEGWSLPGGRVLRTEALQDSASRIVLERAGLKGLLLQQYQVFGDSPMRRSKLNYRDLLRKFKFTVDKDNWLLDRTLTIGYYALVEFSLVNPRADIFTEECAWFDIHDVPELLFDHNELVERSLKTLQRDIYHQPVGINLLPGKFTLPEIHDLYETILDKSLDRRNFPKKLLSLGIIKKLDEQRSIGPHRSPYLYKFDKKIYEKAIKEGWALDF